MTRLICFDAEFANLEILELSVFADTLGGEEAPREIFHSLFKPEHERSWPGSQRVHHISPAMVRRSPYFRRHREEIQKLIDGADCLVGFAIENDIEALRREGVEIPDGKAIVDVRDLHWLVEGNAKGIELDARKGLAVTAAELEIEFKDEDAHGASYDTLKTLECFRVLMDRFAQKVSDTHTDAEGAESAPQDLLEAYFTQWNEAREIYMENFAHGWVSLIETRDGYRLKASRIAPPDEGKAAATIEVKARQRALNEIDAHFDRKRHRDHPSIYVLKPADIEWFKAYTNVYDADEPMHRRLHELRQKAAVFR